MNRRAVCLESAETWHDLAQRHPSRADYYDASAWLALLRWAGWSE